MNQLVRLFLILLGLTLISCAGEDLYPLKHQIKEVNGSKTVGIGQIKQQTDCSQFMDYVHSQGDWQINGTFGDFVLRKNGDQNIVNFARNCSDINQTDEFGKTPLHVAVYFNLPSVSLKLIELNANVDVKVAASQYVRDNALSLAIRNRHFDPNSSLTAKLLDKTKNFGPALIAAASRTFGYEKVISYPFYRNLIDRASHLDQMDMDIALLDAASSGSYLKVRDLIELGANVNFTYYAYKKTPLHSVATSYNPEDEEDQDLRAKTAILLIENGADLESQQSEQYNDTPLHTAARFGVTKVAQVLIKAGANIDSLNDKNQTPLYLAIDQNRPQVVKLLVESEADVTKVDEYNNTYMQLAAVKYASDFRIDSTIIRTLMFRPVPTGLVSTYYKKSPSEMVIHKSKTLSLVLKLAGY